MPYSVSTKWHMIIGTSKFFKTEIFVHSYNPNYNKSLRNNAQRKNIMKILKMIFPFHNIYAGKDNTVYFKYV